MDRAVAALWERLYPPSCAVDASLIEFNTSESGLLVPEACTVADDGFLIVKSSKFGTDARAHIAAMAFKSDTAYDDALADARKSLSTLGFEDWQFGGDWRHFFPGVPVDCRFLVQPLLRAGFKQVGYPCYDVERDLQYYAPPVEPSPDVRECVAGDSEGISAFLLREFPGRWQSDVMEKFGEDPARVLVLVLDGAIEGFAMIQMDGDVHRRAGAVWSASLGPGWAALGPIGVSKSVRGQGHGHGLLAAALCSLRDQGARRTIIDWTTLTGFYGRHGFEPTREYRTFLGKV